MKLLKKTALILFAVCAIVLCAANVSAAEIIESGQCGENLTWTFYDNGELVIDGEGAMWDWWYTSDLPWYSHVEDITAVTVNEGVTTIGSNAINYFEHLTRVSLPSTVEALGEGVFHGCFALQSFAVDENNPVYANDEAGVLFNKDMTVLIQYPLGKAETAYSVPDGVTAIGDYAFANHADLVSITFSDTVTTIGEYAFEWCRSLTEINFSDSITAIEEGAFCGCESLTSLKIPDKVTTISDQSFVHCYALVSVTLPEGVTVIDSLAFAYGRSLTEINIPSSVEFIGTGALRGCTVLTEITIPDSVTFIDQCAFSESALINVFIPASVTKIYPDAFNRCNSLQSITVDEGNPNYASDEAGVLFNKDKTVLMQYPIGNARTSYDIPSGVTTINRGSFEHCYSLASITLPGTVTTIESEAFTCCTALTDIIIPASVTEIGWGGIDWCESLTSATVLSRNANYDDCNFRGSADGFTLYGYAGSTTEAYAAENGYNFVALEEPEAPETTVPETEAPIPDRPSIASGKQGEDISWILFEDGELYIYGTGSLYGSYPDFNDVPEWYSYRDSVTKVTIRNGITYIGGHQFENYRNLVSVTIPDSVTAIDQSAFEGCRSLTTIDFGNGVTNISTYAFYGCSALSEITLPESLEVIGNCAFMNCIGLTSITIPENVKSIISIAFSGCTSLQSATVLSRDTVFDSDIFLNTAEGFTLYGYAGSTTETYALENGHRFVDVEAPAPEFILGDINGDSDVDIRDALLLFQHSMDKNTYPIPYTGNVDYNHDGNVDIKDALRLFQYSMDNDTYPID